MKRISEVIQTKEIVDSDGPWLWFYRGDDPAHNVTGKYLFFSQNLDILKRIATTELERGDFMLAKVNLKLLGSNTEYVLCLYYTDDSRKYELAKKYGNEVKYRYWKSDDDTRKKKYSKEFLSRLTRNDRKNLDLI